MVKFTNFIPIKLSLNDTYFQCDLRKTTIHKLTKYVDKDVSSYYHEFLVIGSEKLVREFSQNYKHTSFLN